MLLALQYVPLPHQALFHKSNATYRLLRGGVGSGKTMAGAVEAIRLAAANPRCDGMILAPTWSILHRTTLRAFLSALPRKAIRIHRKREQYIELCNSARVYYASADRPETMEGANLAWAWGDEGRYWSAEAWPILLARVRDPRAQRRSIVITSTPNMGWLYDVWGKPRRGYAEVVAPSTANPYLPQSYLETLRASYSTGLYEQYVRGEFIRAQGAVFPEFNRGIHVQRNLHSPELPVCVAYDPGYRRSATLFFQRIPFCQRHTARDCVHVLGEVIGEETATVWVMQRWATLIARQHWQIDTVYVDPAADSRQIALGTSDVDVIETAGYRVAWTTDPFLRTITTGIESIRSKLAPVQGSPSLYFDATLEDHPCGVLRAMTDSEYPAHKHRQPVSDQPVKDGKIDHARDALRYGLINTCPIAGASRVQVY